MAQSVFYDDVTIEHVAWKLAEEAGYRYGRGPVEHYVTQIREILQALDVAMENREDLE